MAKSFIDTHTLDDAAVLARSLEDPAAFEVLVDRYQDAFLRKALSILRNRTDAEDIVQETFVRIYSYGKRFKKVEGATFASWAYTILERQCFTLYQKRKKRGLTESQLAEDFMDNVADDAATKEAGNYSLREDMLAAISKLPRAFRRIMEAYFFEDKSHEMIAQEENISYAAARTRLSRAKNMLKKILTKETYL